MSEMMMICGLTLLMAVGAFVSPAAAQQAEPPVPPYLNDRGTGIPTSMFGTYIRRGELILYPYFEYYRNRDMEYNPEEFGFAGSQDFRGRHRASEALLFMAYGLGENLAVEFEAAVTRGSLEKSRADFSALPAKITETGLGDVEAQLRWRWRKEDERRPELFGWSEVLFPHHRGKHLIGTSGWELKFGSGLVRGFKWGTLTGRAAVQYSEASSTPWDFGGFAVEYLKRVSPAWRVYVGVEGTLDEIELITEAQWHVLPYGYIKLNNGLGLTSRAPDWAPELGVLFTVPLR